MFLFSTDVGHSSAILRGDSIGNTVSPKPLLLGNLSHNLIVMSGAELDNQSVYKPRCWTLS